MLGGGGGGGSGGGVCVLFHLLQYQTMVMGGTHNFSSPFCLETSKIPGVLFLFFVVTE